MSDILTIADLKDLARRRVPKMFFDYADSGAWTESTYRANEEDFQKIKFRQRVLVDMSNRSLESTMIGKKVSMPVALAPTGLTGMQHADGEMLAAQAAEEFGVPFTLSTMSICSIEDVASVTKKVGSRPRASTSAAATRARSRSRPRSGTSRTESEPPTSRPARTIRPSIRCPPATAPITT